MFDVSVITATRGRPKHLERVCNDLINQKHPALFTTEHIIVSDGPDKETEAIANKFKAKYFVSHKKPNDARGSGRARDLGMEGAEGRYFVFWDDDNRYPPWSILSLWEAAWGYDIGVCPILCSELPTYESQGYWRYTPWPWTGQFQKGLIDTACLCVVGDVAKDCSWGSGQYSEDYDWLMRLDSQDINFQPDKWVAQHIPFSFQSPI